ncbi:MAG: hypothetical protein JWP78_3359 [Mucilaginibacter sp.]|nr:hypothetical protein [Mucilaginibacter sp.]
MQNFDDARKLGEKLFFYKPYPRTSAYHNNVERENLWDAACFFAAVLEKTFRPEGRIISLQKLNEIRDQFLNDKGQRVDLDNRAESTFRALKKEIKI